MRSDDETGSAVDEVAEALFLAGGFRMEVEDDRVGLFLERAGARMVSADLKGSSSSGCMKTRPMMLATRTRAPLRA
jgi:hypothetical protein